MCTSNWPRFLNLVLTFLNLKKCVKTRFEMFRNLKNSAQTEKLEMGRTRLKAAHEEPPNNIKCQNQDKRFKPKKKRIAQHG